MSKFSKVFKYIFYVFLVVFGLEILTLFVNIDIIPFIFTGLICGIIIAIKHRSEGTLADIVLFKNDIVNIIVMLLMCFITILIGALMIFYGLKDMSAYIVNLLNTSIYFRFAVYGVLYPLINIFLIYWCVTGVSIFEFAKLNYVVIIGLSNLGIGLAICMLWDKYAIFSNFLLSFFK